MPARELLDRESEGLDIATVHFSEGEAESIFESIWRVDVVLRKVIEQTRQSKVL